jgi:Glycosyltransferase WbsX
VPMTGDLTMDYADVATTAIEGWAHFADWYAEPYHPCVLAGWDPSPRSVQTEGYVPSHYPFTHVVVGNTPSRFGGVLDQAVEFAAGRDTPGVVLVNAWNEWTEGSFIDLEQAHGAGYLEAIARRARSTG